MEVSRWRSRKRTRSAWWIRKYKITSSQLTTTIHTIHLASIHPLQPSWWRGKTWWWKMIAWLPRSERKKSIRQTTHKKHRKVNTKSSHTSSFLSSGSLESTPSWLPIPTSFMECYVFFLNVVDITSTERRKMVQQQFRTSLISFRAFEPLVLLLPSLSAFCYRRWVCCVSLTVAELHFW